MSTARLLVTRPAREAARWVRELAAQGVAAQALPLIDIVPEPLTGELADVRARLDAWQAVMFVSGNAVRGLFPGGGADALAPGPRAWSPGPGTTQALRAAGWPAARIDAPAADAAQFDSEALWAQVAGQVQAGQRVLIVRGGDAQGRIAGRDWLAERLHAAGAQVDQVLAYRRRAPVLDAAQAALARAGAHGRQTVWLFSSSEAIAHLGACLPGQDWSAARALVTHPRIAHTAQVAGFGAVHQTRPALADVVASIKSWS